MGAASVAFIRLRAEPDEPPPLLSRGAFAWMRANLFSSIVSTLTTLAVLALALWLLPPLFAWATARAIWSAPDGALCRVHQDGACWAFIAHKWDYLRFGSYPVAERWRVNLVKNSSLAVFIGYPDLVQIFAGTVLNQTQAAVQVMAITMAVYLVISLGVAAALNLYNARRALKER